MRRMYFAFKWYLQIISITIATQVIKAQMQNL